MEWVSEDEKKSPAGNGAMSLIPGFSGLYRTENYFGGALFTFMELGLLKTVIGSSVIRKTDWLTRQYIQNNFRSFSNMLGAVLLQILHSLISEQQTGMKRENFRERKHLIIIRLQLLFRGCEDPL